MTVGKRIQELRKENHLTQQQLADQLSVSRQAVSKWESDFNEPDIRTLIALAHIFHVSVDDLIGANIPKENEPVFETQTLPEEIIKTNRKNHSLLVFLTGCVVVLVVIFIVCPLVTLFGNQQTYTYTPPPPQTHISGALENDRWMVDSLSMEILSCNPSEQTMQFSGTLNLQNDFIDEKDKTLIIEYSDQSQVELEIYEEGSYFAFNYEIPAKNFQSMTVKIGDQQRRFEEVSCPIADYLYGIEIEPSTSMRTKDHFTVNLGVIENINDNEKEKYWEDCINMYTFVERKLEDCLDNIKVELYQGKELLQEVTIDNLREDIVFNSRYLDDMKVVVSYQTPLKDIYSIEKEI